MDRAKEMVARARQKAAKNAFDVSLDVAPAKPPSFGSRAFDLVLSTLVLHHFSAEARQQAIAETGRLLRSGERLLIVDVPNQSGRVFVITGEAAALISRSRTALEYA